MRISTNTKTTKKTSLIPLDFTRPRTFFYDRRVLQHLPDLPLSHHSFLYIQRSKNLQVSFAFKRAVKSSKYRSLRRLFSLVRAKLLLLYLATEFAARCGGIRSTQAILKWANLTQNYRKALVCWVSSANKPPQFFFFALFSESQAQITNTHVRVRASDGLTTRLLHATRAEDAKRGQPWSLHSNNNARLLVGRRGKGVKSGGVGT